MRNISKLKQRGGHLPFLMSHSLVGPEPGQGLLSHCGLSALQTALPSGLLSRICPARCVSSPWPSSSLLLLLLPNACSGAPALSAPKGHETRVNFLSYRLVLHRQNFGALEFLSHRELPLEVARMPCCRPGAARAGGRCRARAQLLLKTQLKDFPPAVLRVQL